LDHGVRSGRYTDPEFARLEYEKLWSRVWQMAARLDEVPGIGDYTVYDICDQSIIVTRVGSEPDAIKAYHNACLHRGTALAEGAGSFPHQKIICPFHGWRWDVHGRNEFVLERQEFRDGRLCAADVALREVHVAVWAGFVFVNLDAHPAISFEEHIAPIRDLVEDMAIDQMRHYWWKSIGVPANWKVAQEAFFEAYHVPATHPQLEPESADFIWKPEAFEGQPQFAHWGVDYETYPGGHGRFFAKAAAVRGDAQPEVPDIEVVEAMAARLELLVVGMDAQILAEDVQVVRSMAGKPIPEESSLGEQYVAELYTRAAEQQRPMPKPTPEAIGMWGGEIFIFPNLMILPYAGNAMIYRTRPVGFSPDHCTFEIMSTTTYPAATPVARAELQIVSDIDDPEQVLLIPRQDLGNIPRIQRGLHSKGCKQIWLANHHEKTIMNMHRELDKYLQS
jgi:nitrite reductase/ring-hydroxylating ferredoxin subunit